MHVVFGDRAFEAAGVVVGKDYQANGIAPRLFASFIQVYKPEFMTAYTRNPALIKALGAATMSVYPLDSMPNLIEIAKQMSNTTQLNDAVYHLGRYGSEGLYGIHDPADRIVNGLAFKDRFTGLRDPSNALAVVARTGASR